MEKEQAVNIVVESSKEEDGKMKIPCSKAFEISRVHDVSLKVIGEICDEQKIKIKNRLV